MRRCHQRPLLLEAAAGRLLLLLLLLSVGRRGSWASPPARKAAPPAAVDGTVAAQEAAIMQRLRAAMQAAGMLESQGLTRTDLAHHCLWSFHVECDAEQRVTSIDW